MGSWGVPGPNPARVPLAGPGPGGPGPGPKNPQNGGFGEAPREGPPLYQRQIFAKKGPKENSKTRAWAIFTLFLTQNRGIWGTPKNPYFWAKMGVPGAGVPRPPGTPRVRPGVPGSRPIGRENQATPRFCFQKLLLKTRISFAILPFVLSRILREVSKPTRHPYLLKCGVRAEVR